MRHGRAVCDCNSQWCLWLARYTKTISDILTSCGATGNRLLGENHKNHLNYIALISSFILSFQGTEGCGLSFLNHAVGRLCMTSLLFYKEIRYHKAKGDAVHLEFVFCMSSWVFFFLLLLLALVFDDIFPLVCL